MVCYCEEGSDPAPCGPHSEVQDDGQRAPGGNFFHSIDRDAREGAQACNMAKPKVKGQRNTLGLP